MLKLWLHSPNLTPNLSVGKYCPIDNRWFHATYLLILTSYLLLEPAKQSVFADPVGENTNRENIDLTNPSQPKLANSKSSDNDRRCELKTDLQSNNVGSQLNETRKSCDLNLSAQNNVNRVLSIDETLAIIKDINFWKNIPGFDLEFPNLIPPSQLFSTPKSGSQVGSPIQTDRPFIPPLVAPPVSPVAPPQNRSPLPLPKPDPRYLIQPRVLAPEQVNPTFTQVIVNDVPLTHRSQYEITGGAEAGDRRSTNVGVNTSSIYTPQIVESVSDKRIYRLDYRSTYSQLRTLLQQREVTTSVLTPSTLFGMRQQLSFTGDCLPGSAGAQQAAATGEKISCTYLPGLKTDESSIDPKTFLPTRFLATDPFGEIATNASLQAMKAPGYQGGANGQLLGIDFYFPRVGDTPGNTQGNDSRFDRFESVQNTAMAAVGRIHQTIFANGTNTAIARTVRGFNYISGDRNTGWMAAIQAATELLPNLEPSLPPGKKGGSTAIERTLLLAANNNRTPENSFTAYYSGIGRGTTPKERQISSANYEGIWIGFSPVIARTVKLGGQTFQATGPERIVTFAGGEGGVDSNTNVTALLNLDTYNTAAISNAYVQTYLTRYERDVNAIASTTVRERTNYYPHLSATGNVTTADSVLRYYTGLIVNPNGRSDPSGADKAYVGADFTKVEPSGWSYSMGGIGYINPDAEYYSKLTGNISKQIGLGNNPSNNLNLSVGVNYAIDGTKVFDDVSFRSANSYVNVGARAGFGNFSVGSTYYIATGMPNSIANLLSTNAAWKLSDGLVLSGYYTPINDNPARSPFGASASIRLGVNPTSPTLSLSWNRNVTDLGVLNNIRSGVAENVLAAYIRFDGPPYASK